eukprot:Nitzschia sp. Nitz4//scaffold31_size150131//23021//23380//NITZ4_002812-RA/size150131-processed-gene-0.185-mRNA-1//1//CDS//3329547611//8874//frame0
MSVESSLSRELDIRFIDARSLVNEAKLNLELSGYLESKQRIAVYEEALRIFSEQDITSQRGMRSAHFTLETIKGNSNHSTSSDWQSVASADFSVGLSTHSRTEGKEGLKAQLLGGMFGR